MLAAVVPPVASAAEVVVRQEAVVALARADVAVLVAAAGLAAPVDEVVDSAAVVVAASAAVEVAVLVDAAALADAVADSAVDEVAAVVGDTRAPPCSRVHDAHLISTSPPTSGPHPGIVFFLFHPCVFVFVSDPPMQCFHPDSLASCRLCRPCLTSHSQQLSGPTMADLFFDDCKCCCSQTKTDTNG